MFLLKRPAESPSGGEGCNVAPPIIEAVPSIDHAYGHERPYHGPTGFTAQCYSRERSECSEDRTTFEAEFLLQDRERCLGAIATSCESVPGFLGEAVISLFVGNRWIHFRHLHPSRATCRT